MKKIIITADDYGMSKAVNSAIEEGIGAGIITATNVMVNMPFYQEAVKLKEISSSISVGIHWTLSCGKPVSDPRKIASLVDSDGYFFSYPEFRRRLRKGYIKQEDVCEELTAQYNKYISILGVPDYWNSHQNVHVDFRIYNWFVNTALKLGGGGYMRSHERIYVPASDGDCSMSRLWQVVEPVKSLLLNSWQKSAHKKGTASPQGLVVCLNKKDAINTEYIFNNIQWGDRWLGEYVIHPATENDSPYFGKIIEKRIDEYNIFTSPKTKAIIANAGIHLVNYNESVI